MADIWSKLIVLYTSTNRHLKRPSKLIFLGNILPVRFDQIDFRFQNDICHIVSNPPITLEYNMMFVDNKKLQSHWVSLKRLLVNKLSET